MAFPSRQYPAASFLPPFTQCIFGCTRHSQASLPLLSLARKFARMPHFGPRSSYPQRKLPPTFHALGILCLSSATQIIRPCGQRGFNAVGQWQVYSQDYSPHPVTGFAALLRKECGDCRLYVHSLRQSFASQSSPSPSIAVHLDQSAEQLQELSRKLAYALSFAYRPTLSITFFQPDSRKTGGEYITVQGAVKKVEECFNLLTLTDKTEIGSSRNPGAFVKIEDFKC